MSALDSILNILDTDIIQHDFKWCLINNKKLPFTKDGIIARSNVSADFCEFHELAENGKQFAGVGISVNFSGVIAIDVDKCFSTPFDINTISEIGKEILSMFKNYYCEFSFSGTGMRILFINNNIDFDFKNKYYIKNSNKNIEIYLSTFSARYVTITGKYIYNNKIEEAPSVLLLLFLNKYMIRPVKKTVLVEKSKYTQEELKKRLKATFLKHTRFYELWFSNAPGKNKNESELDYYLLSTLVENVSSNYTDIEALIVESNYYKTKDEYHISKWKRGYFERTLNRLGVYKNE